MLQIYNIHRFNEKFKQSPFLFLRGIEMVSIPGFKTMHSFMRNNAHDTVMEMF